MTTIKGGAVVGQAPACIERLTNDHRLVAREDRLEPHLGRHSIDRHGPFEQKPRVDRLIEEGNAFGQFFVAEMAVAVACGSFGVGFDIDLCAWVFFPGEEQCSQ